MGNCFPKKELTDEQYYQPYNNLTQSLLNDNLYISHPHYTIPKLSFTYTTPFGSPSCSVNYENIDFG